MGQFNNHSAARAPPAAKPPPRRRAHVEADHLSLLNGELRIGARRLCRRLLRFMVPLFCVGKLDAIEVEHEKPNGR
jgi:hypothetical protein